MPSALEQLSTALADRYRIERELGQGGMATVYLAEDLKHHRKVAIKVLRRELAAVLGADRFLQEIRTTANLQHPHILALHDSGEADGLVFYVMPFVDGDSLRSRLAREKQLTVADAIRIASQVAGALEYAHRHGVIHRDIKPENILLQDGEAVVADFGIALAVDAAGGSRLTETGVTIGTPQYMSPEQALGERELDGRSDIYSLGAVLYEMLAGEPPFTGVTAQAIIAKRLAQPVPSVRIVREAVPEALDAALERALARAPADRFATAREFAETLQGTAEATATPAQETLRSRRRLRVWPVVAVVLLLLAAVGVIRSRRGGTPELDPNLLAVVPFDALDPALAVWSEGVVDLLSRTLDGAGWLRTVSPSVVLSRWHGRSDRASATAVAHRAGAGLAMIGSLTPRGADSVEVRAALLDIGGTKVIGEVGLVGATTRVGELLDSLGLEILNALSRDRPVGAARQAIFGSAPLPALKAFLRGEQLYRRGQWDSALVAYNDAIAGDSSLAMAWYRMGQVLAWRPLSRLNYGDENASEGYFSEAYNRNHGLSDRDSLLIAADSALTVAWPWVPEAYKLGWARMDTLALRFPGDPETWYARGERLYHVEIGFGQDYARSLEAFDRVIVLDQGFSPAYEHVFDLALRTDQPDRALRYARVGATLGASDEKTSSVRLVSRLLLDAAGEVETDTAGLMASAGPQALWNAALTLNWWPDSTETAIQVLRWLANRPLERTDAVPWVVDPLMRAQYLAWSLTFRGHLREAYETDRKLIEQPTAARFSDFFDPFLDLALFGILPEEIADQAFRPSLQQGVTVSWYLDIQRRSLSGLSWWAMKRDTAALTLFGRRMSEAAIHTADPADRLKAEYLESASAAYLALAKADSSTALRRFAALPDAACSYLWWCFHEKRTEAALLAAKGQDIQAAAILDTWFPRNASAIAVLTRLERGRIAERLNDRETAIRSYQYLVDAWAHADPELSSYVTQAREGLARLVGEPQ